MGLILQVPVIDMLITSYNSTYKGEQKHHKYPFIGGKSVAPFITDVCHGIPSSNDSMATGMNGDRLFGKEVIGSMGWGMKWVSYESPTDDSYG